MSLNPFHDRGGGTALDVGQQTAVPGGVDQAGQPPVGGLDPPTCVRVRHPADLPATDLIDPEHGDRRQGRRECRRDVAHVGGVRGAPRQPVIDSGRSHAGEPLGDPLTTLGPKSTGQPRPGRDRRDRLPRKRGDPQVNDDRSHSGSRHRHRRLCYTNLIGTGP